MFNNVSYGGSFKYCFAVLLFGCGVGFVIVWLVFLAECFVIDGLGCLLLFVVFWFICCLLLIRWVFWFDWLGLLLISIDCDLIVV